MVVVVEVLDETNENDIDVVEPKAVLVVELSVVVVVGGLLVGGVMLLVGLVMMGSVTTIWEVVTAGAPVAEEMGSADRELVGRVLHKSVLDQNPSS